MSLPDFLIIGPTRTGTTWLHKCLNYHSQLFMPDLKEICYFDKNFHKGEKWYKKYFKNSHARISGEATPGYFAHKGVAEKIFNLIPKVKLIIIYRDPLERAYSHFKIRKSIGMYQGKEFQDVFKTDDYLLGHSLYGLNLQSYLKYFTPQQILILDFYSMVNHPADAFKKICSFLKISTKIVIPMSVLKRKYAESLGLSKVPIVDKIKHILRRLVRGTGFGNKIRGMINRSKVYSAANKKLKSDKNLELNQEIRSKLEPVIDSDKQLFFNSIERENLVFWKR